MTKVDSDKVLSDFKANFESIVLRTDSSASFAIQENSRIVIELSSPNEDLVSMLPDTFQDFAVVVVVTDFGSTQT